MSESRSGYPTSPRVVDAVHELRAALQASYGNDWAIGGIMGKGHLLAASNAKDGNVLARGALLREAACPCGRRLAFSCRQRGDGLCGPCSRKKNGTQTEWELQGGR